MEKLSKVLSDSRIMSSKPESKNDLSNTHHRGSMPVAGMTSIATPHQIDQHLKAILKSQRNLFTTFKKLDITKENFGFVRSREVPEIRGTDIGAVKEVYRQCLELCGGAGPERIVAELTAMSVSMVRRADTDNYRTQLLVYARDLEEYPEDVILEACTDIRRSNKFFPSISELIDACEERYEFRRALKKECEMLLEGRKKLIPHDPRGELHWKEIPQKDWLPQHYDWWVSEAERMLELAKQNEGILTADSWVQEIERRKSVRDRIAQEKTT